MIHYADVAGTLYFYRERDGDPYGEMKDYVGVCTVVWDSPTVVQLRALKADMDRRMQRELLDWLLGQGIVRVKADRAPGRTLPMARRIGDHEEIDLTELYQRVKQRTPTAASGAPGHRRAEDA